MNKELLQKHIKVYHARIAKDSAKFASDKAERKERSAYYQSWTAARLEKMTAEDAYEYISKLWAMRIWGNKQYVVDKLLQNPGLNTLRGDLSDLIWGSNPVQDRWDKFRVKVKGMGPAMMSELLCHVHPESCMLWNRRAYVGLNYLGVKDLPRYNYQLTGERYVELCSIVNEIVKEMKASGESDAEMLTVDYFIWDELQVEENLSQIYQPETKAATHVPSAPVSGNTAEFIHDEVRDKIAYIGQWLGLQARTEVKIAEGAKVDTIWEVTIGNMGRVIYVFEVQTKGCIDSLVLNLLKSLNNPAVQAVVAVSDPKQLESIRNEVKHVTALKDKLKYWDYNQVLQVHEGLESVYEVINALGLVPQGF